MRKIGRPAAGDPVRPTTDDRIHIDIRRWKHDGRLVPGGMFITSAENDPLYSLEVHVADDHLIIHHAGTQQRVALDSTPCNFGGERPWLRCPECGRRAAILYANERFLCRLCHDLAWPVTREKELERAARALARTCRLLGVKPGFRIPLGQKPKGMRWKTYWRHVVNHEKQSRWLLRCIAAEIGLSL